MSDRRWEIDFRVVSNSPTAFYIQTEIAESWYTLSQVNLTKDNAHFQGYRGFYNLKELINWFSKTEVNNIVVNAMWMPSNALMDLKVVSTKNELIKLYPEVLI